MLDIKSRRPRVIVFCCLLFATLACSKDQRGNGDPEKNLHEFELHEIGNLYEFFQTAKGRPPLGIHEVKDYEVQYPHGVMALQSGKCVAVWGIDLNKTADPGAKVLAYRKAALSEGGLVIFVDKTIKQLSAEELKGRLK